jgi:hypothetical protein
MYNSISDAATKCPDLRFVWVILPKCIAVNLLSPNGLRLTSIPAGIATKFKTRYYSDCSAFKCLARAV